MQETEEERKKREDDEKKKKKTAAAAALAAAKKPVPGTRNAAADGAGEDERPRTPPPEDLPLKEIIQVVQEGNKINEVRGLCLVAYPYRQEHIDALKYHNIPIDKVNFFIWFKNGVETKFFKPY